MARELDRADLDRGREGVGPRSIEERAPPGVRQAEEPDARAGRRARLDDPPGRRAHRRPWARPAIVGIPSERAGSAALAGASKCSTSEVSARRKYLRNPPRVSCSGRPPSGKRSAPSGTPARPAPPSPARACAGSRARGSALRFRGRTSRPASRGCRSPRGNCRGAAGRRTHRRGGPFAPLPRCTSRRSTGCSPGSRSTLL